MSNGITNREEGPSSTSPTWRVRPFGEGDVPGLLALYEETFGRRRIEEEFRWKLLGHPYQSIAATVNTIWVADEGGRMVGQHAGIPMRLKLGGEVVPAMHAVEAMTQRDHRREGMLTKLGGALYAHWRDSGIPLIMGLPHAGWGSRAHALGYRPAFPMVWLSRPLRPFSMLLSKFRRAVQSRPVPQSLGINFATIVDGGMTVSKRETAGGEFSRLWLQVGTAYTNAAVRDAQWVQWRYLDPPGRPFTLLLASRAGEPTGYLAYRLIAVGPRIIGRVADLFAHPEDTQTARLLIGAATRDMKSRGADSAAILVAAGSPLHTTVKRQGFVLKRGEYQASFVTFSSQIEAHTLNAPRNWLLTGGDFDVV